MTSTFSDLDTKCMRRALSLAKRACGRVEPNPMVGAVIARGEQVLGEGYHRQFGGAHAEVEALHDAHANGHDVTGATIYVSLEPCAHHGKTPPCTQAIISARLSRVVAAMVDPFEEVAGRGIAQLREAGVQADVGLLEDDARRLNEAFVKRVTTGLPWVIAKWAQTLDGRIATATGDSQWISNALSRKVVHQLRARVDAVMVGVGTALADDPLLTARGVPVRRKARRVVVDPSLRLPLTSALVDTAEREVAPLTIAVRDTLRDENPYQVGEFKSRKAELVYLPAIEGDPDRLNLKPLLRHLAKQHSATNVLVEGGAATVGSLLEQGHVDQVLAFVAPKLLGDAAAIAAVAGLSRNSIADSTKLQLIATRRIDDDMMLDYRVVR